MVRDKARHAMEILARENQANAVRVEWKFGDLLARRPADAGADADD
jgi:hypothetical protein